VQIKINVTVATKWVGSVMARYPASS